MFLDSVEFIEDFRCYEKGFEIVFKDNLTVITGDNGSGKSTLLSCIRQMYKTKWSMSDSNEAKDKIKINGVSKEINKGNVLYLDLSLDLYKTAPEFDYENMDLFLYCLGSSSGQGSMSQLLNATKKAGEMSLIILDEPERGLSIKNQILISKLILKLVNDNPSTQFLLTTHSLYLLSLVESVYSTSHKSYLRTDEYLSWLLK